MPEIKPTKNEVLEEVTAEELVAVEGGLNPQPLPPRIAAIRFDRVSLPVYRVFQYVM
jgi:hypothetical protein